ncbi:MAG: OsmC family peroxiredoxin [Flavobacterium sp.]|nr:MAG: OsmC family peroxiredoxin [Flavobacterium sp.]
MAALNDLQVKSSDVQNAYLTSPCEERVWTILGPEFGGNDMGPSPMELVLMGVAGCSGIDMISILKKQRQEITSFKAEVEGERAQVGEAKPFKDIHVVFYLEGDIIPEKAARAAQLSFEKYCSVSKTLEPTATIHYKVVLNGSPLEGPLTPEGGTSNK